MNFSNSENFFKIFKPEYMYYDCLDFSRLLDHSETPETYPLLHRYDQIENWKISFPNENLLSLWVGCAQFIINFARNMFPEAYPKDYSMIIAFSFFYPNDEEYLIPYINVGESQIWENEISDSYLVESKTHSPEMAQIMNAFESCSGLKKFRFYESRFRDPTIVSETVWIYCI